MEKSKVPTMISQVFCDHFDTTVKTEMHETESGETKVKITLAKLDENNTPTDEKISVSLYRDDVSFLASSLFNMADVCDKRVEDHFKDEGNKSS